MSLQSDASVSSLPHYRRVLQEIDDELSTSEIDSLKFLCRDFIPESKLEQKSRAIEIIQLLEDQLKVTDDDLFLLAELLLRIQRNDLVKRLGFAVPAFRKVLNNYGSSKIPPYRVLLFDISEDLESSELETLKFAAIEYISRPRLEKISECRGLFQALEKVGELSEDHLQTLADLLGMIRRHDLVQKIEDFQGLPRAPTAAVHPRLDHKPGELPPPSASNGTPIPCDPPPPYTPYPPAQYQGGRSPEVNPIQETRAKPQNNACPRGRIEDPRAVPRSVPPSASIPASINQYYSMNARPFKGMCVIINNENFFKDPNDSDSKKLDRREGSVVDAERLERTFTKIGFKVVRHGDLTTTDVQSTLMTYSRFDHSQYNIFVCCLLSHGCFASIYGTDGYSIPIRDLTNPFKAATCRTLKGKPKLFFIQACQGTDKQEGVPLEIQTDGPSVETIPNEADFLLGFATVPGFASFRHPSQGSWYITTLTRCIEAYHDKEDILHILTIVNREVGRAIAKIKDGQYKQCPAPQFTLRHKLRLTLPSA